MELLLDALRAAIEAFGLDFVLRALVEAGVLPSWVLPDVFTAQEHEPYRIEQTVDSIANALASPTNGLDRIYQAAHGAAIDATAIAATLANIQTQISNLPIPPATDSIAAQVWGFPNSGEDIPAYSHLLYIERFAGTVGRGAAFIFQDDPFLVVKTSWKYPPD